MAKNQRGPRFQIHLSTAVVLMFVAGGLMWANFHPAFGDFDLDYVPYDGPDAEAWFKLYDHGWPLVICTSSTPTVLLVGGKVVSAGPQLAVRPRPVRLNRDATPVGIVVNTLVALWCLSLCAFILECYIAARTRSEDAEKRCWFVKHRRVMVTMLCAAPLLAALQFSMEHRHGGAHHLGFPYCAIAGSQGFYYVESWGNFAVDLAFCLAITTAAVVLPALVHRLLFRRPATGHWPLTTSH